MLELNAVIFDMDGLMIDTEPVGKMLVKTSHERFGYEITEDMFYHLIGTNEKTSKAYYHSVFGEDYPYQKIKDYRDQLRKEYFNSHPLEVKKGLYDLLEDLKKKKAEGYTIYICSASVEAYLRFCKLPVDEILGTKTDIKDGKYTSQMIGKNCKNEEKVKRIQEVIKNHNLEIDYDLSYAYSDSLHDIPMLKMVKNRIKIDTKDGHMSTFEIE